MVLLRHPSYIRETPAYHKAILSIGGLLQNSYVCMNLMKPLNRDNVSAWVPTTAFSENGGRWEFVFRTQFRSLSTQQRPKKVCPRR